ncbi:putative leucine-rich repeat domain superfamily [Arabidopsis thaliana]
MDPKAVFRMKRTLCWTNDTKSDYCLWKVIECDRTSGRVIKLSFGKPFFKI